MKNITNNQLGSSMVEFAILVPVLMLIVFGVINFGIQFYDQAMVTNAAREGARWGSIHTTLNTANPLISTTCARNALSVTYPPASACDAAANYLSSFLISFGAPTIVINSFSSDPTGGTSGSLITTTVTYSYTGVGYYFNGRAASLTATSAMYHE